MKQLLQEVAQALRDAARYGAGDWSELVDALERRSSPANVPEGWKLAPIEPTKEMVEAAYDNVTGGGGRAAIYAAMLAAAPPPPVSEDRWQPIETAPKYGRELILILTPSGFPQVTYSNTWWIGGFSVECKPTHWMPLPKAPAMEGK